MPKDVIALSRKILGRLSSFRFLENGDLKSILEPIEQDGSVYFGIYQNKEAANRGFILFGYEKIWVEELRKSIKYTNMKLIVPNNEIFECANGLIIELTDGNIVQFVVGGRRGVHLDYMFVWRFLVRCREHARARQSTRPSAS